jgi:hypothetical protein
MCSFTVGRDQVEGPDSVANGTAAEHAEGTRAGTWTAAGRTTGRQVSPP